MVPLTLKLVPFYCVPEVISLLSLLTASLKAVTNTIWLRRVLGCGMLTKVWYDSLYIMESIPWPPFPFFPPWKGPVLQYIFQPILIVDDLKKYNPP